MNKTSIPKTAADKAHGQFRLLTDLEAKLHGFDRSFDESPHVNLKHLQTDFECFSDWGQQDLKEFSSFLVKLRQSNWNSIFQTGGKSGNKQGLAYTKHKDRNVLPQCAALKNISPEIDFFELRVTQKARVHGFRSAAAFFLVWLDKDHRIYPM